MQSGYNSIDLYVQRCRVELMYQLMMKEVGQLKSAESSRRGGNENNRAIEEVDRAI